MSDTTGTDATHHRGHMHRANRLMPDEEARAFLMAQKVAHVATLGADGWPYVIPLIYIYEGGDRLFVHTGNHQGHFERNLVRHPRACVEVSEMGPIHPGRPYACNSSLVYTSVVTFGAFQVLSEASDKTWFFDRVLEKYGEAEWAFEPGYPQLDRIVLYEQRIEIVTGKHSAGRSH
jgi:nitroimidazol reductase NimA-like FMN-containing flavoprotein (pyridoxamine 5'-phosphate oxidase superfamily)